MRQVTLAFMTKQAADSFSFLHKNESKYKILASVNGGLMLKKQKTMHHCWEAS